MVAQSNKIDGALWHYSAPHPMDEEQITMWLQLLFERTGISWPEKRKSFLLTSLSTRMRELGFSCYEAYFSYLTSGRRGAVEWEILVDYLTVHESRFYRDQLSLSLINDVFLPSHCEKFKNEMVTVNVWSIGCSTGEEPYSLAMLFDSYFTRKGINGYYSITASDISAASLSIARKAIYHTNRLKNLPDNFYQYYFIQSDEQHFEVRQHIRDRICFTRLNLIHMNRTKVGMMDLIYCQNVLIYFNRVDRNEILDQMVKHLQPGGLLMLGTAEVNGWQHDEMEPVSAKGTLAFKRKTVAGNEQ